MNKRIFPWYIVLIVMEILCLGFAVFIFINYAFCEFYCGEVRYVGYQQGGYKALFEGSIFVAGLWLPFLAVFIGSCVETAKKLLWAKPTAAGVALVIGIIGSLCTGGVVSEGNWQLVPIFYAVLTVVSIGLLIGVGIHSLILRKKKRAEFTEAPRDLFKGKPARCLVPLAILTAVNLIFSVIGCFSAATH